MAPGGPAEKHGVLRPEDELLEVSTITHTTAESPRALFQNRCPSHLYPAEVVIVLNTKGVGGSLQVNGVQVCGKSRREVVSFLKEAPPPFTLVCCRRLTSDLEPESETESEPEPAPKSGPGLMRTSQPSVEEVRGLWNTHTHILTHSLTHSEVSCVVFFRLSCSCRRCFAVRQNLQKNHR